MKRQLLLILLLILQSLFVIFISNDSVSAAAEDFTTFTEVDPDNRWTQTETRCTVTEADRDEEDYVYKDYGVGYFGSSWKHNFTTKITSVTTGGIVILYMQANALSQWVSQTNAIAIEYAVSGSNLIIYLRDRTGTVDSYTNPAHDGSKIYYMDLSRSGETLTLDIYNDSARTDLADTLSINMVTLNYRYLYAGSTLNQGDSGYLINGYIENLFQSHVPTIANEGPANGSTGISVTPALNVTVDDLADDMLNATWYSNSSGAWVHFGTNASIDTSSGAVNIIQTNSNFSESFTTYYWSVNLSDDTDWTNKTYHFTTESMTIVNASTSIEETNATLHGYISVNASGSYSYGFWVGTSTPVTEANAHHNMTGVGTVTPTGDRNFSHNDINLSRGTHYYVKAWVSNATYFASSSNEDDFYTKCDAPTGFTATVSGCNVDLAWTKGTGADKTTVVRNATAYPANATDGTVVYNNTGTSYSDTTGGGSTQYYNAWSWTGDKHSDENATATLAVPPCPPTSVTGEILSNNTLNISWTAGTGANTTLVVRKADSSPSSRTDGTVIYNDTGTYTITSDLSGNWYYRLWSYANHTYSSSVALQYGALSINCYDEETNASLYFDVFISNESGSETYESLNNTNPHTVNVTDLPMGDQISIRVSPASNYSDKTETFTYQFTENETITYVVLAQEPESKALTNVTCKNTTSWGNSYPAFTLDSDVITILADAADEFDRITVNYTHYEYESRTYYRDLTTNHIFVLNAYLPSAEDKQGYLIRVVDGAEQSINDAYVLIKRNVNGSWVDIASDYTDGNGYISIYLVPDILYKFVISKTGFVTEYADWTPLPSETGHTFQLEYTTPDYEPEIPTDQITITTEISDTTLFVNYTDDLGETEDIHILIYEYNYTTNETTLIDEYSTTDDSTINEEFTINTSNAHYIVIHFNHSSFGHLVWSGVEEARGLTTITTQARGDTLFDLNYGTNPFGWSNFLMFLFITACFFSFDEKGAGVSLIICGGLLLFINYVIGFNTTLTTLAGGGIPVLFVVIGIMVISSDKSRRSA